MENAKLHELAKRIIDLQKELNRRKRYKLYVFKMDRLVTWLDEKPWAVIWDIEDYTDYILRLKNHDELMDTLWTLIDDIKIASGLDEKNNAAYVCFRFRKRYQPKRQVTKRQI